MTARYVRYTVVDAQYLERCVTEDWPTYPEARRARDQLALTYGEHFGLRVAGIDAQGDLHLLADTPSPSVRPRQPWTSMERWVLGVGIGVGVFVLLLVLWDNPDSPGLSGKITTY